MDKRELYINQKLLLGYISVFIPCFFWVSLIPYYQTINWVTSNLMLNHIVTHSFYNDRLSTDPPEKLIHLYLFSFCSENSLRLKFLSTSGVTLLQGWDPQCPPVFSLIVHYLGHARVFWFPLWPTVSHWSLNTFLPVTLLIVSVSYSSSRGNWPQRASAKSKCWNFVSFRLLNTQFAWLLLIPLLRLTQVEKE